MAELNVEKFYSRLGKIHASLVKNRDTLWNQAACLSIHRGEMSDDDPYLKSTCLHQYLFGYELPDTVFVLTESGHVFFLATKKKCEFLNKAVNKTPAGGKIISVSCHVKGKDDGPTVVQELYRKLWKDITEKSNNGNDKLILGVLDKEWDSNSKSYKGNATLVEGWQNFLISKQVDKVDASGGIGIVMATKDTEEMDTLRKSSILTNKILKHGFIPRLEEIIEKEINISHEALSNELEDMIDNPSKIQLKVPQEQVQSCFNPIIQSGGEYDLRVSAQSNSSTLKYDIITVACGSRYQLYCSNVARTFLVDPPKSVQDTYETLVRVQDACISAMKPGSSLKAVYAAAIQKLQDEKRQDLIDKLPKNLGFSIGLDFREPTMLLTPKNSTTIRTGMVFNLSVGFSDLVLNKSDIESIHEKSPVKKLKNYSLLLADMILVTDTSAETLTKHSKGLEDITYVMNSSDPNEEDNSDDDDDDDEDEEEPEDDEALARKLSRKEYSNRNSSGVRSSARLASNQSAAQDATIAEREKRQIELMERRNEERVREMARAARKGGSKDESSQAEELETYKGTRDFPDNVLPNQVKVDMVNKCVILPIGGNPVPFHISTIKNVVLPDPDAATYLRINFYSAGISIGKDTPKNMAKLIEKYAPYTSFIREMTFRSLDPQNLTDAFRKISELRKRERMKEVQDQEEADLVQQEQLIRTKNERVPRLSDLTMRPSFAKQKTQGNLEAHSNGLRFQSNRGEVVDIIYSNIKHAFFQDCKQEIMVLIHFHLKNPIMVGKKKQDNIQFFTEVIEASQAIDDSRRRMNDPDELDDEQRERQLRRKLNDAFKNFSMKVESVAKKNGFNLEFDVPYRDRGFQGTPNKEMVYIMPTLNCLVNLTENPFFVVDLSEIDHVHFERVTFSSKAFDIVLVNKDFSKMPARIDMIPNADKESIQEWLTDMEITYTEGPMNLNWKTLMETIKGEDRFYHDTEEDEITAKEAGWSFLRMNGDDDSSEAETVEDDSDFDEEGEEEESEEEEDESEFDEEDEEESDYDADEDLEEQGMDWDEMERKAINDDRKRGRNEADADEGQDRRRRSRR